MQYINLKLKQVEIGDLVNVFLERTETEPRRHRGATIVEKDGELVAQTSTGEIYKFDQEGVRGIALAWDDRKREDMTEEEKEDVRNSRVGRGSDE